jgi:NAD(P)-dependent dehydrogenase (short-subunit alcohol dehydrogenase family)
MIPDAARGLDGSAVLDGKVAIVTGAASGIGERTARTLAARGAAVVVADIDERGAKEVAESISAGGRTASWFAVDVSVEDQVAALVQHAADRFGGLDVMHNNAADTRAEVIGQDGTVDTMDVGVWDQTMAVNLRGTMLGCKHAIPRLLERGGGVIVNTSSNSGLSGDLSRTAYGASKAGINALTMYVATQYGMRGIRCNAVSPGLVMTPAAERNLTGEAREIFRLNHLTPRFAAPDDIARVVAFLASDDASFINGQVLCVDGGMLAHTPTYAQFMAAYQT